MKPLNTLTGDALEQMIDYKVVDQTGASIGTLHSLWSDPTTGAVEFLGVKTGWLFGHNHVVPAEKAELDDAENVVRLPYTEMFIKEAPSMSADAEISEAEEDEIFRYYGLPRRQAATGEFGTPGDAASDPFAAEPGSTAAGEEEADLDGAATYIGIPTKLKDTADKNISITNRSETPAGVSRLRKTSRPSEAGEPRHESLAAISAAAESDEVVEELREPQRESLTTIAGMTSPTNEDFINGGAAAVTTGIGSGASSGLVSTASTSPAPAGEDERGTDETHAFDMTDVGLNPDPITGEPGSHPVGTGVGAAGAGAAGVAIGGTVGGPVGAVVGGIAGAIGGGLAGKGVAESINPTVEKEYWRANYANQSYYDRNYDYSDYEPAYRVGYESFGRGTGAGHDFATAEPELEREYQKARGASKLNWEKAKLATRAAWDRVKARGSDSGSR